METLLHSYVEVREPMELSFEVVRRVGPGIGVLGGGRRAPSGRGDLGVLYLIPQFVYLDYRTVYLQVVCIGSTHAF